MSCILTLPLFVLPPPLVDRGHTPGTPMRCGLWAVQVGAGSGHRVHRRPPDLCGAHVPGLSADLEPLPGGAHRATIRSTRLSIRGHSSFGDGVGAGLWRYALLDVLGAARTHLLECPSSPLHPLVVHTFCCPLCSSRVPCSQLMLNAELNAKTVAVSFPAILTILDSCVQQQVRTAAAIWLLSLYCIPCADLW